MNKDLSFLEIREGHLQELQSSLLDSLQRTSAVVHGSSKTSIFHSIQWLQKNPQLFRIWQSFLKEAFLAPSIWGCRLKALTLKSFAKSFLVYHIFQKVSTDWKKYCDSLPVLAWIFSYWRFTLQWNILKLA